MTILIVGGSLDILIVDGSLDIRLIRRKGKVFSLHSAVELTSLLIQTLSR